MENKNNTTFYSIGLNEIKRRELRKTYAFNPSVWNLLIRFKVLFE